ncbi:MAG: hypothetical protein RLZZ524_604 [Pseudomonadota bacterium]|jgi:capsid protein
MSSFSGASDHPLLQDWLTLIQSHEYVWASEYRTLASRGEALACNDPFIAALTRAHVLGTLGPTGLRATSLYDPARDLARTPDAVRSARRQITAITDATWYGRDLDAEAVRTRLDLEMALTWSAFVRGEGVAIRVWRDGVSRWRMIDPRRIANPQGRANSDNLRDGFVLADGRVVGVWVHSGKADRFGSIAVDKPVYVAWTATDGTPNVIHRTGYRLPGMLRGVSRLAPMIIMSRQLSGVLESHVAAKRLQAIFGMVVEAEDPEAYKAAVATGTALGSPAFRVNGPLNVWVKPTGSKVEFTDAKFNGADLKDYLTLCYKVQCASVQVPVDVVLCQMGEASLSSARAGLDQFDRTCQAEQEQHIAECTAVIDRAAIAGSVATGAVSLAAPWSDILAAKYSRPPKYSTDRLKDANTISALIATGVSRTTAFSLFGLVYEDEAELRAAEAEFERAQQPAAQSGEPAATDVAATWWRRALAWARTDRTAA